MAIASHAPRLPEREECSGSPMQWGGNAMQQGGSVALLEVQPQHLAPLVDRWRGHFGGAAADGSVSAPHLHA